MVWGRKENTGAAWLFSSSMFTRPANISSVNVNLSSGIIPVVPRMVGVTAKVVCCPGSS